LAYLVAGTTAILRLSGVSPAAFRGRPRRDGTTGGLTTGSTTAVTFSGNAIVLTDLSEHKSTDTYAYVTSTGRT